MVYRTLAIAGLLLMLCLGESQGQGTCHFQTSCWTTTTRPAAPVQGQWGFNTDTDMMESYDGTRWVASSSSVVDVRNYGAVCGGAGVGDDTAAIQSAINAAKAILNHVNVFFSKGLTLQFPANQSCNITSTLNFTSVPGSSDGFVYDGVVINNANINCRSNGTPCVDMRGTRGMHWNNLTLVGDFAGGSLAPPNYGIVMGSIDNATTDHHVFESPSMWGRFSVAAVYNFGSEGTIYNQPLIINSHTSGYAMIFDGYNHWNVASPFITQTLPVDTSHTNNQGPIIAGKILNSSTSATEGPVWVGGVGGLQFISGYLAKSGASTGSCQVTWWFKDNDIYLNNSFNNNTMHVEPNTTDYAFCIDGPATSPVLRGFVYAGEFGYQPKIALFRILGTSSATSASLLDTTIKIEALAPNNLAPTTTKIFDDATKWTVSGNVFVPVSTMWQDPAKFNGQLCIGSDCRINTWSTSARPATPLPGQCGYNTDTNQWECYNPLNGEAQFDAAKLALLPGADTLGNLVKWSGFGGGVVLGPMLTNPSLPGGPYGSNAISVLKGAVGIWNQMPYGWSHAATGLCVLTGYAPPTNLNDAQGACIVAGGYGDSPGIPQGSGSAAYGSRDTVALGAGSYSTPAIYPVDAAACNAGGGPGGPCASNYFAGTYTATTFTPSAPISGGIFLRVGMTVDTNDATPFSGIISSFTLNGAKAITGVTVPGWFQTTAGCLTNQANCPESTGIATLNNGTGGSGLVSGTYNGVTLTTGTGVGVNAKANIVINAAVCASCTGTITISGTGYVVGNSVTVSGSTFGGSGTVTFTVATVVPLPTGGAALSRQSKVFGSNIAATKNKGSEANQVTTVELDCNNASGVDETNDTMQVSIGTPYTGCLDLGSISGRSSYGMIVRRNFVTQVKLEGDSTYGVRASPFSGRTIGEAFRVDADFAGGAAVTIGYSHKMTAVNSALRIWDPGGDIFADAYRNEWRFGRQKTTGTAFNMKFWSSASGNNDGTSPDATWTYSGGSGINNGNVSLNSGPFSYTASTTSLGVQFTNSSINALGPSADQTLFLISKGNQSVFFETNGPSSPVGQAKVLHTASATERITFTGAATGGDVKIGSETTDALTPGVQINPLGNTIIGTGAALATSATLNHLMIPTTAGAPTGAVGAAGKAAILLDTTNRRLCANASGTSTWNCAAMFVPQSIQATPGTTVYTPSVGAVAVRVMGCGGGGGGGGGSKVTSGTTASGGAGGGGGGCFDRTFRIADIGSSINLIVGAGGTGGAAAVSSSSTGSSGTAGNPTCVSTGADCTTGTRIATAGGGGFGFGGQNTASSGGGAGGCPNTGGSVNFQGGNGTGAAGGTGCNSGGAGGFGSNGTSTTVIGFGSAGGGASVAAGFIGGSAIGLAAAGGGSGGVITATPGSTGGGNGGWAQQTTVGGGGVAGGAGANNGGAGSINGNACVPGGSGGGGGGANHAGNAGNGGAGAGGGGGGGGGSSLNANTPGAGGNGGDGFICAWEM